jgi:GNAT superfamily N-acetyltransferase
MPAEFNQVIYQAERIDILSAERLAEADDIKPQHAYEALGLLAVSYARQFEAPNGPLPQGAFQAYFNPDKDANVDRQHQRMRSYVSAGSQYWYLRAGDRSNQPSSLAGLAKATPSKASRLQKTDLRSPNCFLNDIVVDPALQGRGCGSLLMHVVTKYSGFDEERIMALDGYVGNKLPNLWFKRLGMLPTGDAVTPLKLGSHELAQVRYTSSGGHTLGTMRHRLERSRPWLAKATAFA